MNITDETYPELLRLYKGYQGEYGYHKRPHKIYHNGNIALLQKPSVAIIGTRNPSPRGKEIAYSIAEYLTANGCVIVSGGALGIDIAAHKGAHGQTIALFNGPVDSLEKLWPFPNKDTFQVMYEEGALFMTEYIKTAYTKGLTERDYLQAALSSVVIPVQAGDNSGTRHAVQCAHHLRRAIYVPCGTSEDRAKYPQVYKGIDQWANDSEDSWGTIFDPYNEEDLRGVLQTVLDIDEALRRKATLPFHNLYR